MPNPRRSTRLVNTPKIDYEEPQIELKSISKKKKKDENEFKSSDKKFKKIKLRHEVVTTELVVNLNGHNCFQDDEDTIVEFSTNESDLLENSLLNTSIEDTATRYKLNDETNSKNDINFLSNESIHHSDDRSVDSQGFLIPDDTNTNLPSSQDNQNIIDVTDYDKFFDLDESTIENSVDNTIKDDEIKNSKKRIKKFVKKQKPRQNNTFKSLVKVTRRTVIEDDSQATEILNENLLSNQLNSPEKLFKKQANSKTKDVETSFVDFFKNENISKSNADKECDLKDEVSTVQATDQPPKRKRGRPRKSDVKTCSATVKSPKDNQQSLKPVTLPTVEKKEIVVDLSNDCDIIEIKNNEELDLTKSLSNERLIDPDKEDDLVLIRSDEPWTVKYRPLCSDEVLDNEAASNKIKEWIDDFIKPDSRYYDDDFEESLESCVLIYGPTGCGKTSMVYALAEELNYKVFEINCSSRRNSKFINQIKEATLSHTVTRKSTSNSQSPVKTPKQQINRQDCKQKTLFNFFQKKKTIDQEIVSKPPLIDESSFSQETVNNLKSLSINSNSLILIDDVDIIFEEDTGFWQALQMLIENTKRPIILTATNFLRNIKQEVKRSLCVQMNYPAKDKLKAYLEEIVAKECYDSKKRDDTEILADHIETIDLNLKDHHCDIRGCLNRLQFDFSSVNISKSEESTVQPDSAEDHHVNNENKGLNEFNAKNYDNLILSDLLSSNFQINSRNESDNSCFIDDNYQVKDLKESILVEFNRLNDRHQSNMFENDLLDDYCMNKISWSNDFHKCKLELDKYFLHLGSRDNLFCDYLPYLSTIMNLEEERLKLFLEHTRRAKRFLPYLDSLNFHLSDGVKQFLSNNYLNH